MSDPGPVEAEGTITPLYMLCVWHSSVPSIKYE